MIDPKLIRVEDGHNPRDYALIENRAHLDELKASIKASGVLQPLLVRWDIGTKQVILVDGECRLRACLELIEEGEEIVAVPTMQVKATNEIERLLVALTANTGKPLSKWEIGSSFKRLIGMGWDAARIAQRLGYREAFVNQSLELSDAPEDVKHLLSEQAVTPSLAIQHLRESGTGAGATLREAASKAKAGKKGKKAIAKRQKKETFVRISTDVMKAIRAALEEAEITKDKKCADLAAAALKLIVGK